MGRKGLVVLAGLIVAAWFLYEPVKDRFFTDTTLTVAEAPVADPQGLEKVIEEGPLETRFSSVGARIVSARLRDFSSPQGDPVELVSPFLKTRGGLRLEIPGLAEDLDDHSYGCETGDRSLTFVRETAGGIEVRKTYEARDPYGLETRIRITNRGPETLEFREGFRLVPFYGMTVQDPKTLRKVRVSYLARGEEEPHREKAKALQEPLPVPEGVTWMGIQDRYFTLVAAGIPSDFRAAFHPLGQWQAYPVLTSPPFSLDPGEERKVSLFLYLGPLVEKDLAFHGHSLDQVPDYGTFDLLGRGVLFLLNAIHESVSNYGLCLILLALFLRLLLFPLTQYNLRSLREMPRVLQEIYDIQDDEETDPETREQRLQPLRRKQIRSMIGSFLPMAIQIPIFLALYQVLRSSIDLRQAPFLLWVRDLSSPDPLYLLPLVMGLAMILQQRLTTPDPKSSRAWILMPVGLSLAFSLFPAGLVLFWTADTLFSVAQLAWIALRPISAGGGSAPTVA